MAHEGIYLNRAAETDILTRNKYSQRSVLTEAERSEGFHGVATGVATGVGVGGMVKEATWAHSCHPFGDHLNISAPGLIPEDSRASIKGEMQVVRS